MSISKKALERWAHDAVPVGRKVPTTALLTLWALVHVYDEEAGEATPSRAELAGSTQLAVGTVKAALRELERAGLIRRRARLTATGVQLSSAYTFAPQYVGAKSPVRPLVTIAPAEAPTVERDPRTIGLDEGHVLPRTTRFGSYSGTVDANGRVVPPSVTPTVNGRDSSEHRTAGARA